MTKTPHPARAAGCTPKQIEAFEQIGAGVRYPSGFSPKTFEALLKKGLIEICGFKIFRDRCGEFKIPEFQQPLPVHYQWCTWCGENVSDEELENA